MRRTGIDVSSTTCVAVDGERWHDQGAEGVRLHGIASLPTHGADQAFVSALGSLIRERHFPARAWVNLWDVRSVHQYVLLPLAPADELVATARRRAAAALGVNESEIAVATSIGATRGEPPHAKREVTFFAASVQELSERLKPIEAAGFRVEGVTTPCGALWSLASLRRPDTPREVYAYVALGARESALAIFSGRLLLYARDLGWGFADGAEDDAVALERDSLAAKLSTELRYSFLYLKQYWDQEVSQVLLTGDMPEIRSLTVPLIERLNIEVETLDSLVGFDLSNLPPGFSDRVAGYRLASAIAAVPSPANLAQTDVEAARVPTSAKWILAGGIAASVALLALLSSRSQVEPGDFEQRIAVVEQPAAPAATPASEPEPQIRFEDLAAAEPPQDLTPLAPIPNPQSPTPSTKPAHRITGILLSAGRRIAFIDDQVVGPGDRVGPDTVREIRADAVVLANDAGEEHLLKFATGTSP
jgi:hypothetical protein